MTTSVTFINNGPGRVTISPIDDSGQPATHERVTLAPSERHDVYVYGNRNVHVQEGVPEAKAEKTEAPQTEKIDGGDGLKDAA